MQGAQQQINYESKQVHGASHLVPENCRVCDSRGGCLSELLCSNKSLHRQLQDAKRIYQKGDLVFREGDLSTAFYVIRSGSVKTYFVSPDGEEQVLGFYLPGDIFGLDMGARHSQASTAITLETTSLCHFPMASLSQFTNGSNLLALTSEQMLRDHRLVLMLARKDADGRMASFLMDLAQRYHARGYSWKSFHLTMSRQDIGAYLGLAIETVSRTLTRFQEAGLLEVNRREIIMLKADEIARLAGVKALA